MTFNRLLFGILVIQVLALGVMLSTMPEAHTAPASALTNSFDHSPCQYPDRTTNPPNGCDNSDPCDPANVKGGTGYCENDNEQNHETSIALPVGEGK